MIGNFYEFAVYSDVIVAVKVFIQARLRLGVEPGEVSGELRFRLPGPGVKSLVLVLHCPAVIYHRSSCLCFSISAR